MFTWYTVVTASLHVKGGKVQGYVACKGKQSFSKSVHHHVILCV